MNIIINVLDKDYNKVIQIAKSIRKSCKRFNKSNQYDHIKEQLSLVPTFIYVNHKYTSVYATAAFKTDQYNRINNFILNFSPIILTLEPSLCYDIISHEIAHCIDFLLRGDSFHDDFWKDIHKTMGGTGNRLI